MIRYLLLPHSLIVLAIFPALVISLIPFCWLLKESRTKAALFAAAVSNLLWIVIVGVASVWAESHNVGPGEMGYLVGFSPIVLMFTVPPTFAFYLLMAIALRRPPLTRHSRLGAVVGVSVLFGILAYSDYPGGGLVEARVNKAVAHPELAPFGELIEISTGKSLYVTKLLAERDLKDLDSTKCYRFRYINDSSKTYRAIYLLDPIHQIDCPE